MLLSLLFIWMIRMRRSQSNGRTDSTSGTSVETISVQSSPTESPVMSPRCEAVNSCVRVSNAGPSPSGQTVKYRRHVNVTPTVPQEDLLPCCHRSHQLLPGSNAVSVYLTCLDCRHHAKWTHRTGSTFQQFPELQQNGSGMTVLCMCRMERGCLSYQFFVCGHLSRRSLEQSWRSGTACSEKGSEKPC